MVVEIRPEDMSDNSLFTEELKTKSEDVYKRQSLMDEIPLMALEPELTSCFMIVPSP